MSAIGQNDRRIQYTTAGGEPSFAYDFQIDDADHIQAYRDGVLQIRGTHYSVTGVGNAGGGDIVPDASLTIVAGEVWTITGDTPEDRSNDYSGFVRVPPQTIDDDLDRMIFMLQQLRRDSNRAIRIDIEEATDEEALRLPGSAARASKTLGFDANGDVVVVDSFTSGASTPGDIDASVQDNDVIRWDSSEGDFKRVAMAVQSVLGRLAAGTDTTAIALSEKQILGRLSGGDVKGLTQEEARRLLDDPEHATDSATDAYVSATNTTPPADGVKITRDFQSANTTTTPTLDGKQIEVYDPSAVAIRAVLWPRTIRGPHTLQWNAGRDRYLVLDPRPTSDNKVYAPVGRDGNGRFKATDPSAAQDVATKAHAESYADTQDATFEQQRAQAWVNFQGTSTVAIRDHYNVSSITDNGTGEYTVNFSTNLANNVYAVVGSAGNTGTTPAARNLTVGVDTYSTSAFDVRTTSADGASQDVDTVGIAVFGGE